MGPNAPFPIHPHYTAIAMAYVNAAMIADRVLPRVTVMKQEFKYQSFDFGEQITIPDTKVGRTGKPNTVEFTGDEVDSSTKDYALDNPIPNSDIENQPENYDVVGRSTEQTTDLIGLDREVRVATLIQTAANYPAGNKVTLAGASQWSHADSDPISDILAAIDALIMRPNVMTIGRQAATKLRTNPAVIKAYNGSLGDKGLVPLNFLRELFELEDIAVGEAFVNTAKPGQAAVISRAWGGHASLHHINHNADTQRGASFGYTAQFGTRVAAAIADPDIGMKGGIRNRVGESVREVVSASDLGYFFEDVIA